MEITLNNKINEMFKGCGLRMVGNNSDSLTFNSSLPTKFDLNFMYDNCNEETKISFIKEFLYSENHFEIFDWKFFLPNLEVNKQEMGILTQIFASANIYYRNESFRCRFRRLKKTHLQSMLTNKYFIERLPKDFQLKALFLPNNQAVFELKREIAELIVGKISETNVNIILPKLIMNNLDKRRF